MAHHDAGLAVRMSTLTAFLVRSISTADTPAARSTPWRDAVANSETSRCAGVRAYS
jgi:hypothetical protein